MRFRFNIEGSDIINQIDGLVYRTAYIENLDNTSKVYDTDSFAPVGSLSDDVVGLGDLPVNGFVGYYFPDGYEYISAMYSPDRAYKIDKPETRLKAANAIVANLYYLNKDADINVLRDACSKICKDFSVIKTNKETGKKTVVEINSDDVHSFAKMFYDGIFEMQNVRTAKFFWQAHISYERKMRIVRHWNAKAKRELTFSLINGAVTMIIEDDIPMFITSSLIAKTIHDSSITPSTVRNYMPSLREEISKHNISVYNTDDFNEYRRSESILAVKNAISVLRMLDKSITKYSVHKQSGLSKPTISRIWEDESIQDILNGYNDKL